MLTTTKRWWRSRSIVTRFLWTCAMICSNIWKYCDQMIWRTNCIRYVWMKNNRREKKYISNAYRTCPRWLEQCNECWVTGQQLLERRKLLNGDWKSSSFIFLPPLLFVIRIGNTKSFFFRYNIGRQKRGKIQIWWMKKCCPKAVCK